MVQSLISARPVHTFYGGAHLYRRDAHTKMGDVALKCMDLASVDASAVAALFGEKESESFLVIANLVREKLKTAPIEDHRIDFEDGYGQRTNDEEDAHARTAAIEMTQSKSLPRFIGIRTKDVSQLARAERTLRLFLEAVGDSRNLPPSFIVTVPKVTCDEDVEACTGMLEAAERTFGLASNQLKLELMIEDPRALLDSGGTCPIPRWLSRLDSRLFALHLGAYDLLSACHVPAPSQSLDHPICVQARTLLRLATASSEVACVDGATNEFPGTPKTKLSPGLRDEWIRSLVPHARNVERALRDGFFQGWDLHPSQLIARFATLYRYFLSHKNDMTQRMSSFLTEQSRATLLGTSFDDAATGRGLALFFSRGLACGAFTTDDLHEAGLNTGGTRVSAP